MSRFLKVEKVEDVSETVLFLRFLNEIWDQLTYHVILAFSTLVLFCFLASLYNLTAKEFYTNLSELTGLDYRNYDLSLQARTKTGVTYHLLCKENGLSRDFTSDFIVLGILKKYKIKNLYIPLYESRTGSFYFFYKNKYTSLT